MNVLSYTTSFNAVVAVKGIGNVVQGIRKGSLGQALDGAAQVAFGVAFTAAIASLNYRVIDRVRIISSCGGISGILAWSGIKDLEIGDKRKGAGKMLLGLAGLAVTVYMVYTAYQDLTSRPYSPPQETLSEQQCKSFVESHKDELNQIYETRFGTGDWKKLGTGGAKIAFTHPESPQTIIKIPTGWCRSADNMQVQFNNIQYAKNIVSENRYQYIAIPDAHLVEMDKGHVLCETKFEFDHNPPFYCWLVARNELTDFLHKGRFCDINLLGSHNAKFLKGSCKIGVFDFDCRK